MDRYLRNILINDIGKEGQKKLLASKVLVIGAGGLGSPVLYYLAAAGVGTLGIIDYDIVDITNLQRQILHGMPDIGKLKIESAKGKLQLLNTDVNINVYQEKFTEENAEQLLKEYDFIVDCCDSYETKFLINDVCVRLGKAYSHGAILAMQGEVMTYTPGNACYRCLFGTSPERGSVPMPSEEGTLGAVAGIIGSIQAAEAIKYITGAGILLINRFLLLDALSMNITTLRCKKLSSCFCSFQIDSVKL